MARPPTQSVPREVAHGGGWGSRDTEATGPCSQTDGSSSPPCRTGRVPRVGPEACAERGRGLAPPGKKQEPESETGAC